MRRYKHWLFTAGLAGVFAGAAFLGRPYDEHQVADRFDSAAPVSTPTTGSPLSEKRPSQSRPLAANPSARAELEDFLARSSVPLSPEEVKLLENYGLGALHVAISDAEEEMVAARTDQERSERQQQYLLALNLAAKLAEDHPSQTNPAIQAAYLRYQKALSDRTVELSRLSPDEHNREAMRLKEEIIGPVERSLR
jgi:hypothetical protein